MEEKPSKASTCHTQRILALGKRDHFHGISSASHAYLVLLLVVQYLVEGNVSQKFLIDFIIGMAEIVHSEAILGLRVRKYYKAVFRKQLFKHNLWSFLFIGYNSSYTVT